MSFKPEEVIFHREEYLDQLIEMRPKDYAPLLEKKVVAKADFRHRNPNPYMSNNKALVSFVVTQADIKSDVQKAVSLIGGFEKSLKTQGECVDEMSPSRRGVRMVFQEHALWPHMRVFHKDIPSNLSFGMKLRKQLPQSIEETAGIIAKRLGIAKNLFVRKPDQLSVGQKQVVGIGRALTIIPKILLLDEPLAHVDPQHRLTLRRELKDYHNKMGAITLYVSHNLPEAFSLADRIAIMHAGKIIQVGRPQEIQSHPANAFVKDFIACFEL